MPILNRRHNTLYDRFFRILTDMLNNQQVINRNIQTLQQIHRENIAETTNLNYEVLDIMREYISLERDNEIIHTLLQDNSAENITFLRNLLYRSEGERRRRHRYEEELSQNPFSNINTSYYSQNNRQTQRERTEGHTSQRDTSQRDTSQRGTSQRDTSQRGTSQREINRNGGLNFFDLIQRSLQRNERNNGLTRDEIDSNCTSLIYQDISSNFTRCPIGLHDFEPDERILQVNYCGHIFNEQHLRRVFVRDSRCPICRHNLRERTQPRQPRQATSQQSTNMGNIFSSIFSNSTTIPVNTAELPIGNNTDTLSSGSPIFRNRRDLSGNLISMEASFLTTEPTEFFRNLQENLNNETIVRPPSRVNENNHNESL